MYLDFGKTTRDAMHHVAVDSNSHHDYGFLLWQCAAIAFTTYHGFMIKFYRHVTDFYSGPISVKELLKQPELLTFFSTLHHVQLRDIEQMELTKDNIDSTITDTIDAGKTLFVRFIASEG